MKTKRIVMGTLILGMMVNGIALAKPERLQIKSDENRSRQKQAKALAKTVDLSNVEDPEARKALQVLFNAANLETQK